MQFTVLALALAGSAVASEHLYKRADTGPVLGDLDTLTSQIKAFQTKVNALGNVDPFGALALLNPSGAITTQIKQTTTDVQSAGRYSPLQSADIADGFVELIPTIESLLSDLIAAQPKVKAAGIGLIDALNLVNGQLVNDQQASADLVTAVQSALDPAYAVAVPVIGNLINEKFNNALTYFPASSSSSGGSSGGSSSGSSGSGSSSSGGLGGLFGGGSSSGSSSSGSSGMGGMGGMGM